MPKKPIWSSLSILSCLALPSVAWLLATPTGDGLAQAVLSLIGASVGALLGFGFGIAGFIKKEQPRWLVSLLLVRTSCWCCFSRG